MKIGSYILQTILFVLLPLALGVFIYDWFSGAHNFVTININFLKNIEPTWEGLIYNVPDGLWAFSLMSAMLIIWQSSTHKIQYFWIFLVLVLTFGSEFAQKFGLINGTFDWWDVLAIGIGSLLSLLVLFTIKK